LLLIDDEPRVARALQFAVAGRDVRVSTIRVPADLARQVQDASPDAILLDVGLGDASGLDLCRQLKGDARTKSIPLLILSGQTDARTKAASFAAGADDFIAKPFVPTELLARVEAQLARGRTS
jgi:two-component system phosphate regulon response regulator PhoB